MKTVLVPCLRRDDGYIALLPNKKPPDLTTRRLIVPLLLQIEKELVG